MRPSVIAGGFYTLTQLLPGWRRRLWKACYDALARHDPDDSMLFMNYGYDDEGQELTLSASDKRFKYPIQLYATTVGHLNLEGKDLLEVGCGRGGGGDFLVRDRSPATYTGVDLSPVAIEMCRSRFTNQREKWLNGQADQLPVDTCSIDVVLNVESSHSYPCMLSFLKEVHRVLRPNGTLFLADFRPAAQVLSLETSFVDARFSIEKRREITPGVLRALDQMSSQRQSLSKSFPRLFRSAFQHFAGVKNSAPYNMFRDGRLKYLAYELRRQ